jgi:hypothetical protein
MSSPPVMISDVEIGIVWDVGKQTDQSLLGCWEQIWLYLIQRHGLYKVLQGVGSRPTETPTRRDAAIRCLWCDISDVDQSYLFLLIRTIWALAGPKFMKVAVTSDVCRTTWGCYACQESLFTRSRLDRKYRPVM